MLEFKRRNPSTVLPANIGADVLFLNTDGYYYTKDSANNLKILGKGIKNVQLVSTTGLNKLFRITFDDDSTFDYTLADGRSITGSALLSTSGLVDTYRLSFNDNTVFDYTVTNAKSISTISKTNTTGLVDTYRIAFNVGSPVDYTVTNAKSIVQIDPPASPGVAGATDTYTVKYNNGPDSTFVVKNGNNGSAVEVKDEGISLTSNLTSINFIGTGVTATNSGSVVTVSVPPAPVQSVHGRTGAVTAVIGDYSSFFTTPAQAAAAAPVQSIHGRTGAVTAVIGDYSSFFTTPAQAAAAAPVQSVNGTTGAVVLTTSNINEGSNLYYQTNRVLAGMGLTKTVLSNAVTLASSLSGFFFNAADYGPLVSGSDAAQVAGAQATANRQTIQATINAVKALGGGVVIIPKGTFHIDATLLIDSSCVNILGAGALSTADVGSQTGKGTTLFWNNVGSSATTAMIDVVSPQGAGNPAIRRSGVEGISLQCAGNVGIGLRVKSMHFGKFADLYIINPSSVGISTECYLTGTELGEAADVTKCTFDNISIRLLESPSTATGFKLDGATNANTSNSTFRNTAVSCYGAQLAFDIRNTDSNSFYDTRINQSGNGTVQPVRFRGGTAVGLESRGNVFYYLAAGGSSAGLRGVYSEGTETGGVTAPAKNNAIFGYSIENGEPYPVIGTGATLLYQIIGGTQPFSLNSALLNDVAFNNTAATVGTLVVPANAITPGTTFDVVLAGSVINTIAPSNLVVSIRANGIVIATGTLALGATAFASPGRGFFIRGSITFRAAGASGSVVSNLYLGVNAVAGVNSNSTAATTINTSTSTTLDITVGTSAATSTGTIRQATIIQGN